jgi:tetraacyldisaccharide 4'-kinase
MNRAATIALAPLSLVYGAVVSTRSAMYRRGVFEIHTVAAPVISVGNITTGGTGKSPLVEWIAGELAGRGRRVCILTRGYGRADSQRRVVVSDAEQIKTNVAKAGDEPLMLAEALKGKAAVICDANRVAAANWAIQNLHSDVLILDDGFQHHSIARDLDIVTVDATNPFGNGRLIPAGNLREPVKNLSRADCIVLTRTNANDPGDLEKWLHETSGASVLKSKTVLNEVRRLNAVDAFESHELRSTPVAAFCGIGNPAAFFKQLGADGYDVRHTTTFRDHHVYLQHDLDRLTSAATAHGAEALVTTAKDAVKLRNLSFQLPCFVAEIRIEIPEADQLRKLIEDAAGKRSRH